MSLVPSKESFIGRMLLDFLLFFRPPPFGGSTYVLVEDGAEQDIGALTPYPLFV